VSISRPVYRRKPIAVFCAGVSEMIALVASLTLAADYCPKRSEGFTFAALMSITNLASALADNVGALLYQHVFSSRLAPLILVSAAFTAFPWILTPLLRLGAKPQGARHRAFDRR
jgi:MFS family permease